MKKGIVCAMTVLALTLTAAAQAQVQAKSKKQDLQLFWDTEVAGTTLKPGDYKVGVDGTTATVYKGGKSVATFAVRSETAGEKFHASSVVYGGNDRILKEIRIGGTTTKLIVEGAAAAVSGGAGKN